MITDHTPEFYQQQDQLARQYAREEWKRRFPPPPAPAPVKPETNPQPTTDTPS